MQEDADTVGDLPQDEVGAAGHPLAGRHPAQHADQAVVDALATGGEAIFMRPGIFH